jgi:hypothetical protein
MGWRIAALRTQYYPGESVSYAIPYTRSVRDNCVVCWLWTGVHWSACIAGYGLIYSFILCSALHIVSILATEGIWCLEWTPTIDIHIVLYRIANDENLCFMAQ